MINTQDIPENQENIPKPKVKIDKKETCKVMGDGLALAIHLVVSTLMGMGLGYALDNWLGTFPIFFFICMILGFASGMRYLFQIGMRY